MTLAMLKLVAAAILLQDTHIRVNTYSAHLKSATVLALAEDNGQERLVSHCPSDSVAGLQAFLLIIIGKHGSIFGMNNMKSCYCELWE